MRLIINGTKMGMPYINGIKHNAYIGGQKTWNDTPSTEAFSITVQDNGTFAIPTRGVNGSKSTYQSYNWIIDWGDGTTETVSGTGTSSSGIPHTYTDSLNTHKIIIKPNGTATQGWFNAFGCGSKNVSAPTDAPKIILINTPITELMRTKNSYYCFCMFYGCTGLSFIPEDLLLATTLTIGCYHAMFRECTRLTSIPSNLLPATTLFSGCYENMFRDCTGLTSLSENFLPATTLANTCYNSMFLGCTGLTSIPSNLLPATTLFSGCYQSLFYNCSGLTSIGNINAAWFSARTPTQPNMFYYCTNITTPITWANIPTDWK
jgi:hypothetical protein